MPGPPRREASTPNSKPASSASFGSFKIFSWESNPPDGVGVSFDAYPHEKVWKCRARQPSLLSPPSRSSDPRRKTADLHTRSPLPLLVKIYESTQGEAPHSPAECTGCETKRIMGSPDPKHISTSYVERQNLSMRMQMRRFARLTNGFSKKVENHACAVAIHYMHYNFCRIHKTPRVTPAMEAGLADHVWSVEEILALADAN